jgi:signal transduction histidine kinase
VHDNGPGIAQENLETVFDKFGQITADVLTAKPPGTGLGLAFSREIVRHLGGEIWAESDGSSGSTFYFTVPVFHELERYRDEDLKQKDIHVVETSPGKNQVPALESMAPK